MVNLFYYFIIIVLFVLLSIATFETFVKKAENRTLMFRL